MNLSGTTFPRMDAALENLNNPNYAYPSFPNGSQNYDTIAEDVSSRNASGHGRGENFRNNIINFIFITILVISIFGSMGNGAVIWLLGNRIKRNPFSTYILNLAIADLGVLLSVILSVIPILFGFIATFPDILVAFFFLFLLMYSTSQFLLTAISIDRCVAVFFPLWHQRKRSLRFSTIACALIWILSILLTAITCTLVFLNVYMTIIEESYQLIVNTMLCLPVMTITTVSLFIKVCLKARQHRRGRLLTIILLTLLFFLFFGFPFNVISILSVSGYVSGYVYCGSALLVCLNSSVNPVIYFLVGRQWKSKRRVGMKMILQKVFKEEESCTEETPV